MDETYDLVVVGGGPAGLAGALTLARARRSVLVVDAGEPRNAPAAQVHNYLAREGTPPRDLLASGRAEVTRYGGEVVTATVTALVPVDNHFRVLFADGQAVQARRLLVTTGLTDDLPDVPGVAQRWGRDVLHCPYCHGWEARGQAIGILASSPMAVHQALLWRQWSADVTLFRHTAPDLTGEQAEQLAARGITVVDGEVAALEVSDDRLAGVRLRSGRLIPCQAVAVQPGLTARADLLAPLGLVPAPVQLGEHVIGSRIEVDATGATGVAGVWAAGNVADVQAHVLTSAAAGLTAGAAINADLVAEDTRWAVESHRHEPIHGQQAWDDRYRSRPRAWSGNPNPALVAEIAELPPGTALDAGAGEGADACWLAARGWQVTGIDLSTTALERAAAQADRLGLDITWVHADLTTDSAPGRYDLVTAHYLHLPPAPRQVLFAHLAAAVAPGGTLLIVGHDSSTMPRPSQVEAGWTTADVAGTLGDGWTIDVAETRPRPGHIHDGREITIHDVVLRARRSLPPESHTRQWTSKRA